jgi:hypothetical protein
MVASGDALSYELDFGTLFKISFDFGHVDIKRAKMDDAVESRGNSEKAILILDNRKLAEGLRNVLEVNLKSRLLVIGFAFSPLSIRGLLDLGPDIVILHTAFVKGKIQNIVDLIKRTLPCSKIVGLSVEYDPDIEKWLKRIGFSGYFAESDNMIIMLDLMGRVLRLSDRNEQYEFQVSIQ